MGKKRSWSKAMKYSLRILLSAVLLLATTASLASEPWWETRKPNSKDNVLKDPNDLRDCGRAEKRCTDFGGTVMKGKYARWCYNPGGPGGPGKYHKYRVDCIDMPFVPLKPVSQYPTEADKQEQKERIARAAERVSTYANSII